MCTSVAHVGISYSGVDTGSIVYIVLECKAVFDDVVPINDSGQSIQDMSWCIDWVFDASGL